MLVNSENLIKYGILIPNGKGTPAQVGYDLTLKDVTQIQGGIIRKDTSIIEDYTKVLKTTQKHYKGRFVEDIQGWKLMPGIYSLTFDQGVDLGIKEIVTPLYEHPLVLDPKINGNIAKSEFKQFTGFVRHRSSILRCGAYITSGVFDPGFKCDEIGATLFVTNPNGIVIEEGARVAQFLAIENQITYDTYNGQYQGDKDKK